MKENLFATWVSTAVTLALGYIIIRIVVALFDWAFVWAIWSVPYSSTGIAETGVCQTAKGHRRLLGRHSRQVPVDPVRALSVR